jgi:hypothetical protein
MQLLYTGGIWGFLAHIEYWVNSSDPSKSDAVIFFSNLNPIIPADSNGACAVQSLQNSSTISLEASACTDSPGGADMTNYVTTHLAQIFIITGNYSSS